MGRILRERDKTLYSPYSESSGEYPLDRLTGGEMGELEEWADELLTEEEWIAPLIPEVLVENSVNWFAHLVVGQILDDVVGEDDRDLSEVSLTEFKEEAQKYVFTYNLDGAIWFKNRLKNSLMEIMHERFGEDEVDSLQDANIDMLPVKVNSSYGYQEFDKPQVRRWEKERFEDREFLISLDDIGDRGSTQECIRKLAKEASIPNIVVVNLVEKMVPDDVDEDKKKRFSPDIALLAIPYLYVLGEGLDDGTRDLTRMFPGVVVLFNESHDGFEYAFQGGNSIEEEDE